MKNLITAIMLLCALRGMAQFPKTVKNKYVPRPVEDSIMARLNDSMDISKKIDSIVYENFKYTYRLKVDSFKGVDSMMVRWDLVKKQKLYYRPYTAMGVTGFGVAMGSMLTFNSVDLPADKKLHGLAGYFLGGGASALIYKKTGKKWAACLGGALFGTAVGGVKELVDPAMGGVRSLNDFLVTGACSFGGALTVRIILK
jgi:hypothetical protein